METDPGYELIRVRGRLAVLDAIAEEHWAEIDPRPPFDRVDLAKLVDAFQRTHVDEALKRCQYNRAACARMLGISRRQLLYMLDHFGVVSMRGSFKAGPDDDAT